MTQPAGFKLIIYRENQPQTIDLFQATTGLSAIVKQAIDFCREWLKNKQEFTLNTSGSTGAPKPIRISRDQMETSARLTGAALDLKPGFKALVCLNTGFIAGVMMLVRCMELGMEAHLVEPSSNPLLNFKEDTKFDFTALVPLQLQTILDSSEPIHIKTLNNMKAIIIGGAPVSYALEQQIQQITAPIYSTYGMTETVSHIALRKLNGKDKSELFKTFDEVTIGLDNRNCLTINSVLTGGETIITNDIVELKDDKNFKWLGRADQVINSGGIKIFPSNVEQKIEKLFYDINYAARFFITGKKHSLLGEALTLYIEDTENTKTRERIEDKLASILTNYERPKQVIFIEKFIETPTAKIDRIKTANLENNSLF